MLSKNRIKQIKSLDSKKGRETLQCFVAEGHKLVNDLIHAGYKAIELIDDIEDIRRVSFLRNPQALLGIFDIPQHEIPQDISNNLTLALDGIQDPGNLGTIIRIADWFGIDHIICSNDTVDCWNPKVVQASMGSIVRVAVHYTELEKWLRSQPQSLPIYATLLEGENIYNHELSANGIIVMGNEGKGISPNIRKLINNGIRIPAAIRQESQAESLNVAIATALVCSEFKRRYEPLR